MADPIIEKALKLKKEIESVRGEVSAETQRTLDGHMDEIMKIILGAMQPQKPQ
jgi:hypothetical protein